MKKSYANFSDLKGSVLEEGLCTKCGACLCACKKLKLGQDGPKLLEEEVDSPDCGDCFALCPQVKKAGKKDLENIFLEGKELYVNKRRMGIIKSIRSLRAGEGQDGGVVTAIAKAALENKIVGAAVLTGKDREWRPYAEIVTDPKIIKEFSGSKYSRAKYPITKLEDALKEHEKALFVGMPCQIRGVRALQKLKGWEERVYTIGLFCSSIFEDDLPEWLKAKSVDLEKVEKMGRAQGKLVLYPGEKSFDAREIDQPLACLACSDFTAELADLSCGETGSQKGYTTAIARSKKGEGLLSLVPLAKVGKLDASKLDYDKERFYEECHGNALMQELMASLVPEEQKDAATRISNKYLDALYGVRKLRGSEKAFIKDNWVKATGIELLEADGSPRRPLEVLGAIYKKKREGYEKKLLQTIEELEKAHARNHKD